MRQMDAAQVASAVTPRSLAMVSNVAWVIFMVRDDHLGAPAKVVKDGHVVTTDRGEVVRDGHPRWSPVATKPSIEPSVRTVNSIKADSGVSPPSLWLPRSLAHAAPMLP